MANESILIVEDSMIVSTHIRVALETKGYKIQNVVTSGEDAVCEVARIAPDLILMDIVLAGEINGVEAAAKIRSKSDIPVIFLTAMTDTTTFESAKQTGPYSYVIKPFDEQDLLSRIEIALYKAQLQKESERRRIAAIIEGQEMERQRVSRELHDGIGQLLTAIRLNIDNDSFSTDTKLQKNVIDLIKEVVDETRRISENLMPSKLLKFNLETCLSSLCERTRTDVIDITFQTQMNPGTINELLKLALYRICQECLNNAIRHSGCSRIFVQLYSSKEYVSLSVEDDGVGFDFAKIKVGNGLRNIKDRVEILGAQLMLESRPGKGTMINVTIPSTLDV